MDVNVQNLQKLEVMQ